MVNECDVCCLPCMLVIGCFSLCGRGPSNAVCPCGLQRLFNRKQDKEDDLYAQEVEAYYHQEQQQRTGDVERAEGGIHGGVEGVRRNEAHREAAFGARGERGASGTRGRSGTDGSHTGVDGERRTSEGRGDAGVNSTQPQPTLPPSVYNPHSSRHER
ncbi:hypothetical protein BKA70DRAFT_128868 [Coprinopsis sp. MPI-PUGE-AT-0042]|nr:hypothetical protein BKA70DRAFT_128868 [Coprinopsis sp. MPI-PUGE-AT-0042]